MSVKNVRVVATPTVRGRVLVVSRTEWTSSEGLSFDVNDQATDLCLTAASLDEWPGVDELGALVDQLIHDLDSGRLDSFYDDAGLRGTLAEVLDGMRATGAQHMTERARVDGSGSAIG